MSQPSVAQMKARSLSGHRAALQALAEGKPALGPEATPGSYRGMRTVLATLRRWGCVADDGLTPRGAELLEALGGTLPAPASSLRYDLDAERVACPGCGSILERTLDDNSGEQRFRCEPCDVQECGDRCGTWAHYFVPENGYEGWAHVDDSECFLAGPAPEPWPPEHVTAGTLIAALAASGVPGARVEETGGGVATILVSPDVNIGPGCYRPSDPLASEFSFSDLYVGPDDGSGTYVDSRGALVAAVTELRSRAGVQS